MVSNKYFIFPINSLFSNNKKNILLGFDRCKKIYNINNIINNNSELNIKKKINLYSNEKKIFIGFGQIINYNILKILKIIK